jgi:hypothetical protein
LPAPVRQALQALLEQTPPDNVKHDVRPVACRRRRHQFVQRHVRHVDEVIDGEVRDCALFCPLSDRPKHHGPLLTGDASGGASHGPRHARNQNVLSSLKMCGVDKCRPGGHIGQSQRCRLLGTKPVGAGDDIFPNTFFTSLGLIAAA